MQVLLLVAAAVILAALAAIGSVLPDLLAPARRDDTDTFYLLNASFRNPNYLHELDRRLTEESAYDVLHETPSVYAHRLKRGKGIIFGYRWYFDRYPDAIDDEEFKKITIWLPEIPSDPVSTFDLSNGKSVIAVYSEGGSAWPSDVCSGYLNAGSLAIRKKSGAFVVTLDGALTPAAVGVFPELCRPKSVAIEFEATELKFDQLTTWLGKRGRHPYAETYRDEALR